LCLDIVPPALPWERRRLARMCFGSHFRRSEPMLRFQKNSVVAVAFALFAAAWSQGQEKPVVIKGATILTMIQGTTEDGTVVIKKGKIAAVGREVQVPPGAEVIDARGEYVLPGLVDPHSHLGVYSLPELQANEDGN